jgi:hypothetical protein
MRQKLNFNARVIGPLRRTLDYIAAPGRKSTVANDTNYVIMPRLLSFAQLHIILEFMLVSIFYFSSSLPKPPSAALELTESTRKERGGLLPAARCRIRKLSGKVLSSCFT